MLGYLVNNYPAVDNAEEGTMYEAFYGLREKPFNLTPDPKYLYLSDKHKEAFAHLLFGIKNRSGFVMVSGEIGTGKTTICRNLLNQLDAETNVAFVFNPSLNPMELLKKINREFGVPADAETVLELTEILNAYLLEAAAAGRSCVLVIDEAQNLTPQVLEQIRLLSNLETEKDKLLQIILIGQPELAEKLALKELRQLNQRITARYHLKPLNEQETLQYIAYRLHVAGGRKKVHFSKQAIHAIYKYSGGTPRVINALCDRALLIGYTKEAQVITGPIVKQAAREIRGEKLPGKSSWRQAVGRWVPSPALVVAAVLVLALARFFAFPLEQAARELGVFNRFLVSDNPFTTESAARQAGTADAIGSDIRNPAREAADLLVDSALARRLVDRLSAPEKSVVETTAGAAALAALAPDVARQAAAAALLRAWNMAPVSDYPESDDPAALAAFAAQSGLAVERLSPALEQLTAIDLPAFVQMRKGDLSFWVALLGVEGNLVRISGTMGEVLEVDRDVFREYYTGEAVVLWRDPTPGAPPLVPGFTSHSVLRLKEQLHQIGRIPASEVNDRYDSRTASVVARLQAETGLLVDGISGKQVRMVLSSLLDEHETPSLSGRESGSHRKPAQAVAVAPISPAPKPTAPSSPPRAHKPAKRTDVAPSVSETVEKEPDVSAMQTLDAVPMPALPEPGPEPEFVGGPQPAPAMRIQDLAMPEAPTTLPPVDTDALKEITPPAVGSTPLVPTETDQDS